MQIKEITLFVFSIHNFKRSDSEVQYLMNMVEKHIDEYNSKKSSNLKESQVRYRVIGQKALFPEKLKRVLGKYDSESRLGDKIVNIAMCYCSDEESSYASLVMKNDFCSSLVTRKFGFVLFSFYYFLNSSFLCF